MGGGGLYVCVSHLFVTKFVKPNVLCILHFMLNRFDGGKLIRLRAITGQALARRTVLV